MVSRYGWHQSGARPVVSTPVITNLTDTRFTVEFDSDPAGVGVVQWGTDETLGNELSDGLFDTFHAISITGLTAGDYFVRAVSRGHDGSGQSDIISVQVTAGGGPNIISGPSAINISDTEATIDWACDVVCTGQVFYGAVQGGPYPLSTTRESSFNWSTHSQTITGLTAGATYYAYVESSNQGGGTTVSEEFQWTMQSTGQQPSGTTFGGGITCTGLANIVIGQFSGTQTYGGPAGAQSFRAERSLQVDSFRYYKKAGASGYASGNGGSYNFFIVADNNGEPDYNGFKFASATKATSNSNTPGDLVTFSNKTALVAGTKYWVVMQHTSPPSSNFVSWNGMNSTVDQTSVTRYHPRWDNVDYELLSGPPDWRQHTGGGYSPDYIAVFQLNYSDGHAQGNSYMEHGFSTGNADTVVTSSTYVRQRFQPYSSMSAVGVGIRAFGNTGTLTAILKTQAGATLETATFTAGSFPSGSSTTGSGARWVEASLSGTEALTANSLYDLEFQSSSSHRICNIRKGSVGWGYSDILEWNRGNAQRSTNSGGSWSNIGSSNFDLPAYLILE